MAFGESTRLRLLRNEPITGSSSFGNYWLYPVVTETGAEESFFAPEPVHNVIKEHNLKAGDEFILSRVQNGKPGSTKLEISIIGKSEHEAPRESPDDLCNMMISSMKAASAVVAAVPELSFRAEDARAIGLSIFIAKSKGL